jgi:hypothetical protein
MSMNKCTSDPLLKPLTHFQGTRDDPTPGGRLKAVRRAAQALREEMMSAQPVRYYKSCDLIRVPYPTHFGLRNACSANTRYIHILNRMFVVQFDSPDGVKTLLVSPSDIDANRETPFFKSLRKSMGKFQGVVEPLIAPRIRDVNEALKLASITPEQVDYITFDHLHTQDIRAWFGTHGSPGFFPNAKLLVMRSEWEAAKDLLPPQLQWYCPDGIDGVAPERVIQLDGSTWLGDSVALVHTPGHTHGNHSIAVRTPEGVMVTSENGVGVDAYAPLASRVPGLAKYAKRTGMEVILNGNTLEGGLDQYISMVQEKEIAGPSQRHPDFPNMVMSSEFTGYWLFPRVKPTFCFGELEFGAAAAGG